MKLSSYKAKSISLESRYAYVIPLHLLPFKLSCFQSELNSTTAPQIHDCFQTELKFLSPQVKNPYHNFMAMVFSFDIVLNFFFWLNGCYVSTLVWFWLFVVVNFNHKRMRIFSIARSNQLYNLFFLDCYKIVSEIKDNT